MPPTNRKNQKDRSRIFTTDGVKEKILEESIFSFIFSELPDKTGMPHPQYHQWQPAVKAVLEWS